MPLDAVESIKAGIGAPEGATVEGVGTPAVACSPIEGTATSSTAGKAGSVFAPKIPLSNTLVAAPATEPATRPPLSASPIFCPEARLTAVLAAKVFTPLASAGLTMPNLPAKGPMKYTAAAVKATLPMVLLAIFLTALPTDLTTLVTAFPTDLNTLPTDLNKLLKKNSGKPVSGLIVPLPPLRRSNRASEGVMCANMVSPLRPMFESSRAISFTLIIPPFAKAGTFISIGGTSLLPYIMSSAIFNAEK